MWDYIAGLIRHFLTIAAGGLIAKGVIDQSIADQIIGGIIALGGVGWSLAEKYLRARLNL